jgi:peptidoglycan-N-acetylglucosamine deacetylase
MQTAITATLVVAIGMAATVTYLSPWLWRRYRVRCIRREVVKKRFLALTYDDGPSAELTPQLLDLLQRRGARATFFMLGWHAEEYPDIVDRVIREGHDVGCHSDQHINAWKASPWKAIGDIDAGYKRLSRWIGPNAMFRPPNGKLTIFTYLWIRRRAPIVWWTIDSGDTRSALPRASEVAERVRRARGGIVLMHDLDRTQARNDFVIEVTTALLDLAEREGLQIVPERSCTNEELEKTGEDFGGSLRGRPLGAVASNGPRIRRL